MELFYLAEGPLVPMYFVVPSHGWISSDKRLFSRSSWIFCSVGEKTELWDLLQFSGCVLLSNMWVFCLLSQYNFNAESQGCSHGPLCFYEWAIKLGLAWIFVSCVVKDVILVSICIVLLMRVYRTELSTLDPQDFHLPFLLREARFGSCTPISVGPDEQ